MAKPLKTLDDIHSEIDDSDLVLEDYFATAATDDIGGLLLDRAEEYDEYTRKVGIYNIWSKSYRQYYSGLLNGGRLNRGGEEGEYTITGLNHYHSVLRQIHTYTTRQELTFEAEAANNDYKSKKQAIFASQLLEYYRREKNIQDVIDRAAEYALWGGEGFVRIGWNATTGEQIGTNDNGAPLYAGDLEYQAFQPYDVIRDFTLDSNDQSNWVMTRELAHKYDLVAKYPDLADDISAVGIDDKHERTRFDRTFVYRQHTESKYADNVLLYKFYHKPSDALPQGRYVEFLDQDIVLLDTALPYPEIPVYRIADGQLFGSIFGFSNAYNLLEVQEGLDTLHSIVMTNQITHGVSNIVVPTGANLSAEQISKGLNVLQYDMREGEPKVLNFTNTPPEIFNYCETLVSQMEVLSGVNAVARGNVPTNGQMSGAAMALLETMAMQYNLPFQKSYVRLIDRVGTATIQILQEYANAPRMAKILGKTNVAYKKEFTRDDIDQITRVYVSEGNPLAQHATGRLEIARDLKDMGAIETAGQYMSIIDTGRLDPIIDHAEAQTLLIGSENEQLERGEPVSVLATDDHAQHMREHASVTDSPEFRQALAGGDPEAIKVQKTVNDHIQAHLNALRNTDPAFLSIYGQQQIAPPGAPAPAPAPENGPAPKGAHSPAPQQKNLPKPSSPPTKGPTNPLTGEHAPITQPQTQVQ